MKDYPSYRLTGPAWRRPDDLHRHLARYGVACTVKACNVCEDGAYRDYFYRASTGDEGVRLGKSLVLPFARMVGGLTALALRAVNRRYGLGGAEAVETHVDVRLLVGPAAPRAPFAELILCKYAVRNGWTIRPADGRRWIDATSLQTARSNPRPPVAPAAAGSVEARRGRWA